MRIADVEKKLQEATIDCAILELSVDLWTMLLLRRPAGRSSPPQTCAHARPPIAPPADRGGHAESAARRRVASMCDLAARRREPRRREGQAVSADVHFHSLCA